MLARGHLVRLALLALAAAARAAGAGAKACVGDRCNDVSKWCPARSCGAFLIEGVSADDGGWRKSAGARACASIENAIPRRLDAAGGDVYCVSEDASVRGFQCFNGETWLSAMLDFLQLAPPEALSLAPLDKASCERLELDSAYAGTLFVGGRCCTGGAVPCASAACKAGFAPLGPAVTSSFVSVVLVIIAIVHLMTALQCLCFSDRLVDSDRGTKKMDGDDRLNFKNIIASLGAAHGGFAGVLIFGALQDWPYGKSQIALAALAWYAVLGPVAEAMQSKPGQSSSTRYLAACVSASQAECGGQVPKINYLVLCIPLLIAIGVRAAAAAAAPASRPPSPLCARG